MTSQRSYELRVDFEDPNGVLKRTYYGSFKVTPETDGFKLYIDGFNPEPGMDPEDSLTRMNGFPFSAKDNDNDLSATRNTALDLKGGGW